MNYYDEKVLLYKNQGMYRKSYYEEFSVGIHYGYMLWNDGMFQRTPIR